MLVPIGAAVLVGAVLLTACGDVSAHSPGSGSPSASASGSEDPAAVARASARAEAAGTSSALVYVIDLPGYTLARGSVGVEGADGFGSVYVSSSGARIHVSVERIGADAPPSAPACTAMATGCEEDDGWYRSDPGIHEFGRLEGPPDRRHQVRVWTDPPFVDDATLKAAASTARPASAAEVEAVLPAPDEPVRALPTRGDLPPEGDGAPMNRPGVGG